MLTLEIEWPGLDRLIEEIRAIPNVDLMPVAIEGARIITEGNRRGVLSGLDGFDRPMPALKYRTGKGKKTRNRQVPDFGSTVAEATGAGPFASGLHDNLSALEYRELTGPRLAPRLENSRVIKNLFVRIDRPDDFTWVVVGAWLDVLSPAGVPFLPFHFDGDGSLPRYDLRPIRPQDLAFCENALEAFVQQSFFQGI